MQRWRTYFRVWWLHATNAWQQTFINRGTNVLFMLGKFFRFGMMLLVLLMIRTQVKTVGTYTTDQIVVFFLTYQFIDLLAQVVYRGVYAFQPMIREGGFDHLLRQPLNPLFQALTWHPDINDTLFIIPSTLVSIFIATQLDVVITLSSLLWYLVLLLNGFVIVTSLHIIVLSIGIVTAEVDGLLWLYRDLNQFGRFPISIYREPLRSILFFVVPVGMIMTIPAEILLNIQPTHSAFVATLIGVGSLIVSMGLWKWAIKHYSSASS